MTPGRELLGIRFYSGENRRACCLWQKSCGASFSYYSLYSHYAKMARSIYKESIDGGVDLWTRNIAIVTIAEER